MSKKPLMMNKQSVAKARYLAKLKALVLRNVGTAKPQRLCAIKIKINDIHLKIEMYFCCSAGCVCMALIIY